MFQIQEQKSQIYNVNTQTNGNSKLEERINEELKISPIIVINSNKIVEITPTDILNEVRKYSSSRSVFDEATTIAIDLDLLKYEAIKAEIEKQAKIGSKQGLQIEAVSGDGEDLDIEDENVDENSQNKQKTKESKKEDEINYKGQFAMYYARILFFAFLTDSNVKSLEEIITEIEKSIDNQRIAKNLNLSLSILKLFQKHINPFVLSEFDYKIQNINSLANDTTLTPMQRASNAMKKFSRLGDSEIVTPELVTDMIIDILPSKNINDNTKFLDIASKQGEFVYAVYKKYGKEKANNFYSIPTSKTAYEFTRKVYSLLELDINHIEQNYTSYDLIGENKMITDNQLSISGEQMDFDIIVGNPPYQIQTKDTSDNPIYHHFIDKSYELAKKVILIHPARFLFNAGKTPKHWNQRMLNDKHIEVKYYRHKSNQIFPDTDIKGGIAITYRDQDIDFGKIGIFTSEPKLYSILKKVENYKNFEPITKIIFLQNKFDLQKLYNQYPELKKTIGSNGKEKRLTSPIFEQIEDIFTKEQQNKNDIKIYGLIKNKRTFKWIDRQFLDNHPNLNKYKVLVPKANGSGVLGEALSTPMICEPNSGFTFSFISFGAFEDEYSANAVLKYIKTKFARALLGILKITQDNLPRTWSKIPLQDFTAKSDINWNLSIKEIDKQLYEKYSLSKEEIDFIETMIKPMG